jgi:TetR/AcrR family transcriptional regulator, transcriptional repressor of bet genes
MPRPRNTAARRTQIVDALRTLMATRGYDGASVAAIARQAGLAPGLVHYHFANKEEILLALVESIEAVVEERLQRRLARAGTDWERLDAWIDAHVARDRDADADAVACWVAIGAEAVRKPAVRAAYEGAVLRDLRQLELLLHGVGCADTSTTAVALLSAVEGAYRLSAGAPNAVPLGFAAPALRRMARGLVG